MNKRIRELAEQATRKYDRLGFEIPFAQPDLEVFAELIIQECLKMADEFELEVNRSGLVDRMKEHFGVEE